MSFSLLRLVATLCLAVLLSARALAHDSIDSETRINYLARLQELRSALTVSALSDVRAQNLYQIGVILDEIRELFNQDCESAPWNDPQSAGGQ
jgi:hypothetical protein